MLVSLADKLDNARAILRDFRALENEVWQRFSVQDPQLHLWYYRSLLEVFGQRTHSWMVGELRDVIDTLEQAVNRQSASAKRRKNGYLGRDLCPAQRAAVHAGAGLGSRPEPHRRSRMAGTVGEKPPAVGLCHRHR